MGTPTTGPGTLNSRPSLQARLLWRRAAQAREGGSSSALRNVDAKDQGP